MQKQVNIDLIILARESEGITQAELADKIGINQANISRIENGFLSASKEITEKIAKALSFPESFFYTGGKTYAPEIHFYRKAKALQSKELSIINANSIIDRLRIEKLLNSVEIQTDYIRLELDEYETPEAIARELRRMWKVSRGAISDVTALLEDKGIIVVPIEFGTRLISDVTTQTEKGVYIIFLNRSMPPDRKRFTLCHALGHIVMHNYTKSETIEEEADRFAGELLMPAEEIRHQLSALSLGKLAALKRNWKVSMAAILMRAGQINAITSNQKNYLWRQMSAKGYRLREPQDINIKEEEPTLLSMMVAMHSNELNYSKNELVKLLFLRTIDYIKYGLNQDTKLRLIRNNKTL
jgi:Zn-dependent peptidase ImmA (M78 family)/DNA-binding XRE family transcriptional regulator